MTRRRVVHLLVGLGLTGVSALGALWQVNEALGEPTGTGTSVPRLVCPLH